MKLKHTFCFLLALPAVISCNLYAPFNPLSSDADLIEEGMRCLNIDDLDCAVAAFERISDPETKAQRVCTTSLVRSGITLKVLLENINGGGSEFIERLATALLPWNETKNDAAEDAKTACTDYDTLTDSDYGSFLSSMGRIVHCAILVSKTDQFLGSSAGDTECTTPGNNSGTITVADISPDVGGATAPFMCTADVNACRDDLIAVANSDLSGSSLAAVATAINNVPDDLLDTGVGVALVRAAIRSLFE